MKWAYGKQVSETNIWNSGGYWLNPLTEKTQPKLIFTDHLEPSGLLCPVCLQWHGDSHHGWLLPGVGLVHGRHCWWGPHISSSVALSFPESSALGRGHVNSTACPEAMLVSTGHEPWVPSSLCVTQCPGKGSSHVAWLGLEGRGHCNTQWHHV
jgi:hypothetical protein